MMTKISKLIENAFFNCRASTRVKEEAADRAYRVLVYVWQSPLMGDYHKVLYWAKWWKYFTSTLITVLSEGSGQRFWKSREWQNTCTETIQARSSRVVSVNNVCFEKRIATLLRRLPDTKCRNQLEAYPLPHMDVYAGLLQQAAILSTMDASSVYWQADVNETVCNKTAFAHYQGMYRFVQMTVGLKIFSITYQCAINVQLPPINWQCDLV